MKKFFKNFFGSAVPIQDRLYYISLIAGFGISLGTAIGNVLSDIYMIAKVLSLISALIMLVIVVLTFATKRIKLSSIMISITLNFLLFPIIFLTSGGLYSGMILYFILGLFVITYIKNIKLRYVLYGASLIFYGVVIAGSCTFLKDWIKPLSESNWTFDAILCLTVVSFYVVFITSVYMKQYQKEKEKSDEYSKMLLEKSTKDALTGIYNRRYFDEYMQNVSKSSEYIIGMGDIDFFKKFNDTYGHQKGDVVLQAVANCITEVVGSNGVVGRYGGEEFVIYLETSNEEEAFNLLEQVRIKISEIIIEGIKENITLSLGFSKASTNDIYSDVQKRADEKLYEAKKTGRNKVCF